MTMPKISVLIPMYNRKIYIEDCITGLLNQTFQDFEIIIRDDASTDGVFEFVKNNYENEILGGKIILLRNEKNLGESLTGRKLCLDAKGKYVTILHNDDVYLPNALQYLYEVAEKYSADVVHCTNFFTSASNGLVKNGAHLKKITKSRRNVSDIKILSSNLEDRFLEWLDGGIFQDLQYNIFRRDFIQDNKEFFIDSICENFLITLILLMRARVVVKSPEAFYIRRDSPYSQTNDGNSKIYKFEHSIPLKLEMFRNVDKFIRECDFLKNNEEFQYYVKTKIFLAHESLLHGDKIIYGDKSYVDVYKVIEDTFRKHFGDDAVYLALLFHWAHLMHFNNGNLHKALQNCLQILNKHI